MDPDENVVTTPEEEPGAKETSKEETSEGEKDYLWHGEHIKISEKGYEALKRQDKEFTSWQQERAESEKKKKEEEERARLAGMTPEERQKEDALRVIEEHFQGKFLTAQEWEKREMERKGRETLESKLNEEIAEKKALAEKWKDKSIVPSAEQAEKIRNYIFQNGLMPNEAYMAVMGYEFSSATAKHGSDFRNRPISNSAQSHVQTKSSAEENGEYKDPRSAKTPKEANEILAYNSRVFGQQNPFSNS